MYKVTFKGRDIEPIHLDDEKGKKVWDIWLENKTTRIVANNTAFSTGDIKNISQVQKNRSETESRNTLNENREYEVFRQKMLSLPIEKRAEILRFPKIVWEASTSQTLTPEIKQEIKNRQLAYFQEKPNCIYANPHCYTDLIPKDTELQAKDGVKKISSLTGASMLRFIENAIATDLQYSLRGQ